ncbi:outer membrane beta-barrel protein [Hyphomicrobium sp. D-2]|uniref:outer membrane protein n=1 Tax=Hyphomicrobium sp. D-2 TaxID=3041621 RepID=UPI002454A170|nr:outer membrane beta-barrel protein [Hyphomicrobium sp. D-2]MDH4983853.1 outer membrane beta-barrel protein [Hyphomicrobium sp. D-2]
MYVTGGLAVGRHEFSQNISQLVLPAGFGSFDQQAAFQKTSWGWALGGGFEQALSERWSLKLQYLHVDLGSHRVRSFGECSGWPGVCAVYSGSHKVNVKLDTVSASINYRF